MMVVDTTMIDVIVIAGTLVLAGIGLWMLACVVSLRAEVERLRAAARTTCDRRHRHFACLLCSRSREHRGECGAWRVP